MNCFTNGRYRTTVGAFLFITIIGLTMSQESRLRWNGFVSIGGGVTLDDNESMTVDGSNGAGYDDTVSFKPDTVFALQAQADLSGGLSATAQLVARGGNDFNLEFEWAYLSYEATDELTLYAGRKRLPIWLYSDSLEVGYSYHWIRPPGDLYRSPLNTYEGISARFAAPLFGLDSHVEAFYGRSEIDPSDTVHIDVEDFGGLFWSLGYDWVQARVGWAHAKTSTTVSIPFPPITVIDPGNDLNYYTASLTVNYSDFFVISEFAKLDYERRANDMRCWYVSAGYHIGKFTPHLTFSELRENESNGGAGSARVNQTTTVGIRYEVHEKAALKFEYYMVQDMGGTPLDGDADAIAVALDITF